MVGRHIQITYILYCESVKLSGKDWLSIERLEVERRCRYIPSFDRLAFFPARLGRMKQAPLGNTNSRGGDNV